MSTAEPITVLIAALGGQGGGVLAEWLAEAAADAAFPAQATSIPGVAQRTGATTYYMEMARQSGAAAPLFSLYPDEDGVDLLVALEPLEAARAMSLGFVTDRTVVITAAERIFSTSEKMVAGDGAVSADDLIEPLREVARDVVIVGEEDPGGVAGVANNAIFLGAIAAAGRLPIETGSYRRAIDRKGVGVGANTAAFDVGLGVGGDHLLATGHLHYDPAPPALADRLDGYAAALRPLIGHALSRLVDYQDAAYAGLFLERLDKVLTARPGDMELAGEVARRLAARMSYEDIIRVAQLKTRPGRLARIRGELGVDAAAPFRVVDFLKPGREETASLMPPGLGRWYEQRGRDLADDGIPIRLNISSFAGYAMMKVLASLRWWRPRSYRYACEQAAIDAWVVAVAEAAAVDAVLARDLAELALLARGYGRVRSRGATRLGNLLENWQQRLRDDRAALLTEVKALLHQARHDPDAPCVAGGE